MTGGLLRNSMSETAPSDELPDDAYPRIVCDLMQVPHVRGRRVSVLDIYERVEGRGLRARTVADRFDIHIAAVYQALAYYHDHPERMTEIRRTREEIMEGVREAAAEKHPPSVNPRADE
jgi:uncharacterized protein (DUF433 family)